MVVAPATSAASSAPAGAGSATSGVGNRPRPSASRSSSDESEAEEEEEEEEETEWQPPAPKGGTPASGSKNQTPTPPPSRRASSPANQPQGSGAAILKSLQTLDTEQAKVLQAQGRLSSGQGSTPSQPEAFDIAPGEAPDTTVRVVGIPATERHNDGRTFLQDGFGGLEALVQMESPGAAELAHLYDFFEEDDVISDFILTPREDPLSESELTAQLKSFRVKRELASILSQFDAKQLAYRTFGTVSLLRKVTAKYDMIKRRLGQDAAVKSEVELQEEVLRLKRAQQFQADY
ncbi:uncharacterized protein IUM83_19575 [Phytophthora cinnamomi]|uniref:uncharacterized protein n=1 Tax=Phytophthora cinnamomi TaxID=4785 RepID=UPI00355A74EA|nr:hypothetical protein IUM83_19575 [Phytophthora cinnamomi]